MLRPLHAPSTGHDDTRLRDIDTDVQEVIVATNPNREGEATAMYLSRLLSPLDIRVTRLARGLPAGADLEPGKRL